jgi:Domain of unknown function (DUF4383)
MAHTPINHPLRPLYRGLVLLMGVYVLVFGIWGYAVTSDLPFFGTEGEWVLFLRTNPAFSVLSILCGLALIAAAVIGRNVFVRATLIAAVVFMVAGLAMMALLQTDANILAFSMANCIFSFVFGMVALGAALYGKTGSQDDEQAESTFRTGRQPAHS